MGAAAKGVDGDKKRRLPSAWRWVRLEEVCEIVGDSINPQGCPCETFAHYSLPAFDEGSRPILEVGELIRSNKLLFPRGVVLFSKLNPRISRVWNVTDHRNQRRICSTEFLPLLPKKGLLDADYLTFALQEPHLIDRLRAQVAAATKSRERLKPGLVLNAEIPLPSLTEQKRIAAILSDQVVTVQRASAAAEARLEAAGALPDAYLKSVFDTCEAKEWPRRCLGEVATLVQNGIYKPAEYYGSGHPFLRMYNISKCSWNLELAELARVVLEGREAEKYRLRRGDLLFSRVNSFELVGKCGWVGPDAEGYVFENMLIRVRVDESLDSMFIAQQMRTSGVRGQIESLAKRAIGQASINSKDLRSIQIALPPLPLQQRISERLKKLTVDTDRTLRALKEQRETIDGLPAALLRRAFNGDL